MPTTDVTDSYTFQPVEVAAIFNDIQQDFEGRLDRNGFELHLEIGGRVSVSGDRFALRLLFGNLVDNAIKYSHERRTVALRASREQSQSTSPFRTRGWHSGRRTHPSCGNSFARAAPAAEAAWPAIASRIAETTTARYNQQ